jgi:ubiquinone biosynthesis protein COQ4
MQPVSVTYELALKWFEFANLGLPMALLGGIAGPLRLTSKQRERCGLRLRPGRLELKLLDYSHNMFLGH